MMYGKVFTSMYEGSMCGAGADVFAVWTYAIAGADAEGFIELHPCGVSGRLGMTVEAVQGAIDYLLKPDAMSRFTEYEGRKLVHLHTFIYFMPSYEYYCGLKKMEDRKRKNRLYKQKSRARSNGGQQKEELLLTHPPCQQMSDHIDIDVDVDVNNNNKGKKRKKKFVAPTLEEVVQYQKDNPELSNVDAKFFWNYFNDGEWHDSNGKAVRNWKQKFRAWSNFPHNQGGKATAPSEGKTRLFPITGKTCSIKGCSLPACYKDTRGEYDTLYCGEHMPASVKEKFYG
jgi:hypothetical protein